MPRPHPTSLAPPILLTALVAIAAVPAAARPAADGSPRWVKTGNLRIEAETGIVRAAYGLDHQPALPSSATAPATPEQVARGFLAELSSTLSLAEGVADLRHTGTVRSPRSSHVRFVQELAGYPVYRSEIAVSLDADGRVVFVLNGYRPGLDAGLLASPLFSASEAVELARDHLAPSATIHEGVEAVIYAEGTLPRLAYRVELTPSGPPGGDWELLVDAATGEVFRSRNRALKGSAAGTATVFDPDPITTARARYGDPGFVDAGDADSPQLTAQLVETKLPELTFDGGLYKLEGPYVHIVDFDPPFDGVFSQSSPDFSYTRGQAPFEAVNAYHHINHSLEYARGLGFPGLGPTAYSGGIRVDPHGSNSAYLPGPQLIRFAVDGVDSAEDGMVVLHELAHAVHHWLQESEPAYREGVGEGVADYWASSYVQSLGLWPASDPRYYLVSHWYGGSNPAAQRTTNSTGHYPEALTGDIHADGQLFSSTLVDVRGWIGRQRTDTTLLDSFRYLTVNANQQDAAHAFVEAYYQRYNDPQIFSICAEMEDRGYNMSGSRCPDSEPTPASIPFADGFEAGHLGESWVQTQEGGGLVEVTEGVPIPFPPGSPDDPPYEGGYSLLLHQVDAPPSASPEAAATLVLDGDQVASQAVLTLSFAWRKFDAIHNPKAADGVHASGDGGASWQQVYSFADADPGGTDPWLWTQVDLSGIAVLPEQELAVRFEYHGDLSAAGEGFAIDAVEVTGAPAGPQPQGTIPDQAGWLDTAFTLATAPYFSANGHTLAFSADGLPFDLDIDPVSGQITGTLEQTGFFPITVTAASTSDPALEASQSFNLTVDDEPPPPEGDYFRDTILLSPADQTSPGQRGRRRTTGISTGDYVCGVVGFALTDGAEAGQGKHSVAIRAQMARSGGRWDAVADFESSAYDPDDEIWSIDYLCVSTELAAGNGPASGKPFFRERFEDLRDDAIYDTGLSTAAYNCGVVGSLAEDADIQENGDQDLLKTYAFRSGGTWHIRAELATHRGLFGGHENWAQVELLCASTSVSEVDSMAATKPVFFRTFDLPAGTVSRSTGIDSSRYLCGVVGYDARDGDIDETGTGPIVDIGAKSLAGSWSIHADIRTHGDHEDWSVTLLCIDPEGFSGTGGPPQLVAPIPDRSAGAGEPFSFDLSAHFSDPDGDPLTFSASGLPPSLSLGSASGLLSGTPVPSEVGAYTVTVTASDGTGSAQDTWVLQVTPGELAVTAAPYFQPNYYVGLTATWSAVPGAVSYEVTHFRQDSCGAASSTVTTTGTSSSSGAHKNCGAPMSCYFKQATVEALDGQGTVIAEGSDSFCEVGEPPDLNLEGTPYFAPGYYVGLRAEWDLVPGIVEYRVTHFRQDDCGSASVTHLVTGTASGSGLHPNCGAPGSCYFKRATVEALNSLGWVMATESVSICEVGLPPELDLTGTPYYDSGYRVGLSVEWEPVPQAVEYRVTHFRQDDCGSASVTHLVTGTASGSGLHPNCGAPGSCYFKQATVEALDDLGTVLTSDSVSICEVGYP